ncbi:MAG: UTP--glucose-1-phosphate uridylyltransferase [Nitrospirae bacterium]|nr:UTP--glucose-1-phosphate uridylyltransferase [Nitrospirota bacterium]
MQIRKAVIPAAGVGTRLLPVTKAVPKELLPIIDRPSIQYVIQEAVDSGIREIALVVSPGKEALIDYFRPSPHLEKWLRNKGKPDLARELEQISRMVKITKIVQREPLGLGHAVLCAERFIGREPFAVLLPDDIFDSTPPCLKQMIRRWKKVHAPLVVLDRVDPLKTASYGIVRGRLVSNRLIRVEDLVEKPGPKNAPSRLAVIGRYILTPAIFDALRKTRPGWGGEIQLTDGLRFLARTGPFYGHIFSGRRLDMGSRAGVVEAILHFALKRKDLKASVRRLLNTSK